jgi:hypothetical protein
VLSYDLVEDTTVGDFQVYRVWIDGVSPKSASEVNKNHQPKAVGKYVGRIASAGEQWTAIPSFVDHGDPYGDVEIEPIDFQIYNAYNTRKKAVNQLRRLFTMRLAETKIDA